MSFVAKNHCYFFTSRIYGLYILGRIEWSGCGVATSIKTLQSLFIINGRDSNGRDSKFFSLT